MRSSRVVSLAVNAKVATVLGSIPAFFGTVESEVRQTKHYWIIYLKKEKNSPFYFCLLQRESHVFCENSLHTAKTKCRKFETNIPRKGISGSQSQFPHSCVSVQIIFPQSVCLFCWKKYVDRSWDYINRSQTHECRNWDWGRAIPRKGIHKWNCLCSVVAP